MGKEEKSPAAGHREMASRKGPVHVAVVTVSDSRTEDTDISGRYLLEEIKGGGNIASGYRLIKDEPGEVEQALDDFVESEARVIVFNGGTGISKRDTTIDVVGKKLEKTLPGFGELFRMLSYQEVGAAAMFSRATAGVYRGKIVICTPGSPAAVRLAWEKLIAPDLRHLAWEVVR